MPDYTCPLCGQDAQREADPEGYWRDIGTVVCTRCGRYRLTHEAELELAARPRDPRDKAMLAGATRERSEQGRPITICSSDYRAPGQEPVGVGIADILGSLVPRSVQDKVDRSLLNLSRKTRHIGDQVEVDPGRDYPLFFAENGDGARLVLDHLVESRLLDRTISYDQGGGRYRLTVAGWQRAEQLQRPRPEGRQVFVAMWFDQQLREAWENGLRPAIEEAGYSPMRVDLAQFNEKIDDYIIAQIRTSRFLVVDVTGHRRAVYFEAGFAMGLGLPVIFTCQQDHLGECSFDTRQYNHIVWDTPEDLREKLKNRIQATVV